MTTTEQPSETPVRERRRRFDLSATQLIASALAAITATVAASYLGVSGTVIGAAVASVMTVIGNAVYAHSLRTTGNRVRATAGLPPRALPVPARTDDAQPPALPSPRAERRNPVLRRLAFGTVAVFTLVLTVVTGIELVAGRPISDLVRGDSGSGTTLFSGNGVAKQSTPTPNPITVTQTVTAKVVVTTPTVTQTAATPITRTVTPTKTVTATSSTPSAPPTTATGTGTSQPSAP